MDKPCLFWEVLFPLGRSTRVVFSVLGLWFRYPRSSLDSFLLFLSFHDVKFQSAFFSSEVGLSSPVKFGCFGVSLLYLRLVLQSPVGMSLLEKKHWFPRWSLKKDVLPRYLFDLATSGLCFSSVKLKAGSRFGFCSWPLPFLDWSFWLNFSQVLLVLEAVLFVCSY